MEGMAGANEPEELAEKGKNQDPERGRAREENTHIGQTRSYVFLLDCGLQSLNYT